jgi:hypothetical protein
MRSIVLQIALKKGFAGIEDLQSLTDDKSTGPKIKGLVQEAALAKKLNLVIPNTFVGDASGAVKSMEKFNQMGIKQQFVEIIGEDKQIFRDTVRRQGESRAWLPDGDVDRDISIMDLKTNCESKRYEREVFDAGVNLSAKMSEYFQAITGEDVVRIVSDRVFVAPITYEENGKWVNSLRMASAKDPTSSLIPMSKQQFDAYVKEVEAGDTKKEIKEIKEWLAEHTPHQKKEVVKAPKGAKANNSVSEQARNNENNDLLSNQLKAAKNMQLLRG